LRKHAVQKQRQKSKKEDHGGGVQMKRILFFSIMTLIVFALGGCKGHITVDEAYNAIRPVKQLELPDQVVDNLVVEIANVADQSSSYKNRVDLFLNDYPIDPDWLVSNVQNKYVYKFRLRPGYYQIRAQYYAYIGWGEDSYKIISEDMIRVQHDKQTVVSADIVKKPNGEPVNKTMYFASRMENLDASSSEAAGGSLQEESTVHESDPASPAVTLQINTVPEHVQIIIDDKVVGQSPLRTPVKRNADHIVQASVDGYRTKTIFLDTAKLKGKDVYHVIAELEKE
jgi:hypothetical protein